MNQRLKQQGMTLIMLLFIVGLATMAYLVHALNPATVKIERDKKTALALAEAKAALIGWSAKDNIPGKLPCPEDGALIGTPNEGSAMNNCNDPDERIGRLPWRTLGLGDVRDGNGDKLWYALSDGFRAPPINSNTLAQLTVDGAAGAAVAIIFSPGPSLDGQVRTAAPLDVTQYLDLTNNDGDNIYITTGNAGSFNDRLLSISKNDLFSTVALRILGEIRGDETQGLRRYYDDNSNNFPYADTDTPPDGSQNTPLPLPLVGYLPYNDILFASAYNMLSTNGWFPLVGYAVAANQKSASITLNGKTLGVTP